MPMFTKPKHANYADVRYNGKREFEPRVENIDKINSKIKQILSCLSNNDKHQHSYKERELITKEDGSSSKDSARFG